MGFRDLIPRTKGQQLSTGQEAFDPFLTLHREMNRLFDDFSRGFGLAPFGQQRLFGGAGGWPKIEVSESGNEVTINAECLDADRPQKDDPETR